LSNPDSEATRPKYEERLVVCLRIIRADAGIPPEKLNSSFSCELEFTLDFSHLPRRITKWPHPHGSTFRTVTAESNLIDRKRLVL
jgi:hypothetical protein